MQISERTLRWVRTAGRVLPVIVLSIFAWWTILTTVFSVCGAIGCSSLSGS